MDTLDHSLRYEALDATPVAAAPFPHVVLPDFVPEAPLRQVVAGLPKLARGGSYPVEGLKLGTAGQALMRSLEGDRFRRAIAEKFGLALDDAPTMVTLRGASREKDGRIHRDSDSKRVTVLLYLNPAGEAWAQQDGCLRLLRDGENLDNYAIEVPPVNGTLLVFPNGPNTWHGHKRYVGPRYVVQLNYMTNDGKARSELRRHKLSSFVKRFSIAA